MTKTFRRILSLAFALMLFASVVAPASALNIEPAGIYVLVGGTCTQNTLNPHELNTTTTVKRNPDSAWLRTDIELLDGINDGPGENDKEMFWSEDRGVTRFEYTYFMNVTLTNIPEVAYCAHNVLGGTESPVGYVYHEEVEIVWP